MARTRLAARALQAATTITAPPPAPPPAPTPTVNKARAAAPARAPARPKAKAQAPPATTAAPTPIQLFEDAAAWEAWLEANHTDPLGMWLKISKKGTGIASVSYDEALDAALCYGWIDGQKKTHDAEHFIQRFTPRRKRSLWSQRNVAKVAVLVAAGRMRPAGQAEIDAAKEDGRWERAYSSSSVIEVPADFQAALDGNGKARTFFEGLGKTKRYAFLFRVTTAKREETRKRNIARFVELLAEGKTL